MNLRLCLHVEISSLRLFSVAMWGLVKRKNFSVVQRLQRFVRFVYGFALAMIFQVTVKSLPQLWLQAQCQAIDRLPQQSHIEERWNSTAHGKTKEKSAIVGKKKNAHWMENAW